MRLIEGYVHVVRLPMVTPFRTSLREVTAVEDVRVTLVADSGHPGLGSASPTAAITGETTVGIVAAIREYLLPSLYGRDLDDRNAIYQTVQEALQHNASAKAAVDIALHDLYARFDDMPLVRQLGGKGTTVSTDVTVSLGTSESMERQALSLVAQGFSQLKLKVGDHVRLWVDPNQAWSVRETLQQAEALRPYGVEFIEQPLSAGDMRGMAEVRSRSVLPICADEAVYGPHDLQRLLDLRAADILNVKLMKAGGLTRAALLLAWAQAAGLSLMVGSMMEGPASVSAAAALAQAYQCRYVDLDAGYFLQDAKAQGGIRYERGSIVFPSEPGLALTWQDQEEGLV